MQNEQQLSKYQLSELMLSEQELDSKMAWIQQAPKDSASIKQLCLRPKSGERLFTERLELCPERGVVGDRWLHHTWIYLLDGSPDPRLQVSLLPTRIWELACKPFEDQGVLHPGDTFIADLDCSEKNLPTGQRLQVGSAVIEVSDIFNTACSKWRDRYGNKSIQWINRPHNRPLRLRGILCSIVTGGTVSLSDRIEKL